MSCSALDDPTKFYGDSGVVTAANYKFTESDDPITGMGVVGNSLVVYKRAGYHVGYMTTTSSDPLAFPTNKRGIGLYAPYSLVHVGGINAWLGADDFYMMSGDEAVPIGGPIRKKFFEIVEDDDIENVFGLNSIKYDEVCWVAQTESGQEVFVWNYKENQWGSFSFSTDLSGMGGF